MVLDAWGFASLIRLNQFKIDTPNIPTVFLTQWELQKHWSVSEDVAMNQNQAKLGKTVCHNVHIEDL